MGQHITALEAVILRHVVNLKRYAFDSISGLVTMYIVFLVIFYGARGIGGVALATGNTLEGILVGYLLWALAIMAYSELSWDLYNEAQMGTLEQLYVSPIGFKWINAYSMLSNLVFQFALSGVLLALMMVSTGKYLNLDIFSVIPLFLLALSSAYGIGFAVGGLALIFKRVRSFFQIVQFVFVAFIAVPIEQFPPIVYMPLSMTNHLLRQVMVHGLSIWELNRGELLIGVITGVVYLALGLLAFTKCERIAKNKGLLGHY